MFHHPEFHYSTREEATRFYDWMAKVLLSKADTDGDGKMSADEFSAQKTKEREIYQWHKDGKKAGPPEVRERHAKDMAKAERRRFKAWGDADGDGKLTLPEMAKFIERTQEQDLHADHHGTFQLLDKDRDGKLSADEVSVDTSSLPEHLHRYFSDRTEL